MVPNFYMDILFQPKNINALRGAISLEAKWMSEVIKALHGHCHYNEKIPFAIALPGYNCEAVNSGYRILGSSVRVFFQNQSEADQCFGFLLGNSFLRELSDLKKVQKAPDVNTFYAFMRYRKHEKKQSHANKIKSLEKTHKLPYVQMESKTTEQVYPLFIECIQYNEHPKFEICIPNGYGLSTPGKIVVLPKF